MVRRFIIPAVLVLTATFATPLLAGSRVALVIGNGNYDGPAALANPVSDATAIGEKLKALNFEVILATDVDRRGAIAAIDRFSREINGAEIALLFFAGHGIQIAGQNFLLPTDVSVESERALRYSAVDIQEVVAEMERRAEVAIAILDACRDNPFVELIGAVSRSTDIERGLGPMKLSGRGALIAYAAASGDVAADGTDGHSPFTAALVAEIDAPNVEVGLMFRRVARRVIDGTQGDQRPELLVRLVDEVYLNPTSDFLVAATPATPATAPPPTADPIVVADASRQVEQPETDRFFGDRVVNPPDWAADAKVLAPSGWRSVAATATEEQANDTYGTAQALPLAASVSGRISPIRDADWYAVEVPVAGELRVDADPIPPELDVYARIWDSNHAVVAGADWQGGAGPGRALVARFELPGPGKYWIEISDGNNDQESNTDFVANVDFVPADDPFEPNNTFSLASAVPATAEWQATIYPRADSDWYKVWAPDPGLLTVNAAGVPENLDVVLRVWNMDGAVVRDWVAPSRPGGDTALTAELAEPGTYLIEVADGNNDASAADPIQLSLNFTRVPDNGEPNDAFGSATLIDATSDERLAIFPRGDNDWLAIDIDHPGELAFAATGSPEALDVYLRVWNSDKEVVRDWVGPPRPGGDVVDFADLPSPGRYFVEVTDGNNDQSSQDLLDLSLNFIPQADQYEPNNSASLATPLTPGGEVLFNILPRTDTDWFRLEAPSAGQLSVTLEDGPENLDLYYRVLDENRQAVRDWVAPYKMGGATEGFADLPKAGSYFIEIGDGNNDARSLEPATLSTSFTPIAETFEPNETYGTAVPITSEIPLFANILPIRDQDWFLVEAPGPGSFVVTVDEVDATLDIAVRLWDREANASGWVVPPRLGGVTEGIFPVAEKGVYRLEVADSNNDARSDKPYRLTVGFE